ncbi:hypothetical protein, conserved [Plasmodium gonderi]|uniref:CCAAT-box DNA binding protein subunit B n=1 Tax=Plasmodium gonderi TaxID=77519 RepID=A0A1Y1JAU7_PLAGO|nr:hypothetical protein, conserved [Plasmodium gonderi]GAW79616.1 hypothetical protein, conserved [Plasmodium gonderi]
MELYDEEIYDRASVNVSVILNDDIKEEIIENLKYNMKHRNVKISSYNYSNIHKINCYKKESVDDRVEGCNNNAMLMNSWLKKMKIVSSVVIFCVDWQDIINEDSDVVPVSPWGSDCERNGNGSDQMCLHDVSSGQVNRSQTSPSDSGLMEVQPREHKEIKYSKERKCVQNTDFMKKVNKDLLERIEEINTIIMKRKKICKIIVLVILPENTQNTEEYVKYISMLNSKNISAIFITLGLKEIHNKIKKLENLLKDCINSFFKQYIISFERKSGQNIFSFFNYNFKKAYILEMLEKYDDSIKIYVNLCKVFYEHTGENIFSDKFAFFKHVIFFNSVSIRMIYIYLFFKDIKKAVHHIHTHNKIIYLALVRREECVEVLNLKGAMYELIATYNITGNSDFINYVMYFDNPDEGVWQDADGGENDVSKDMKDQVGDINLDKVSDINLDKVSDINLDKVSDINLDKVSDRNSDKLGLKSSDQMRDGNPNQMGEKNADQIISPVKESIHLLYVQTMKEYLYYNLLSCIYFYVYSILKNININIHDTTLNGMYSCFCIYYMLKARMKRDKLIDCFSRTIQFESYFKIVSTEFIYDFILNFLIELYRIINVNKISNLFRIIIYFLCLIYYEKGNHFFCLHLLLLFYSSAEDSFFFNAVDSDALRREKCNLHDLYSTIQNVWLERSYQRTRNSQTHEPMLLLTMSCLGFLLHRENIGSNEVEDNLKNEGFNMNKYGNFFIEICFEYLNCLIRNNKNKEQNDFTLFLRKCFKCINIESVNNHEKLTNITIMNIYVNLYYLIKKNGIHLFLEIKNKTQVDFSFLPFIGIFINKELITFKLKFSNLFDGIVFSTAQTVHEKVDGGRNFLLHYAVSECIQSKVHNKGNAKNERNGECEKDNSRGFFLKEKNIVSFFLHNGKENQIDVDYVDMYLNISGHIIKMQIHQINACLLKDKFLERVNTRELQKGLGGILSNDIKWNNSLNTNGMNMNKVVEESHVEGSLDEGEKKNGINGELIYETKKDTIEPFYLKNEKKNKLKIFEIRDMETDVEESYFYKLKHGIYLNKYSNRIICNNKKYNFYKARMKHVEYFIYCPNNTLYMNEYNFLYIFVKYSRYINSFELCFSYTTERDEKVQVYFLTRNNNVIKSQQVGRDQRIVVTGSEHMCKLVLITGCEIHPCEGSSATVRESKASDSVSNTSESDSNTSESDSNTSDSDSNTSDIDSNTSDIDINTSDRDINTSDRDINTSNKGDNTDGGHCKGKSKMNQDGNSHHRCIEERADLFVKNEQMKELAIDDSFQELLSQRSSGDVDKKLTDQEWDVFFFQAERRGNNFDERKGAKKLYGRSNFCNQCYISYKIKKKRKNGRRNIFPFFTNDKDKLICIPFLIHPRDEIKNVNIEFDFSFKNAFFKDELKYTARYNIEPSLITMVTRVNHGMQNSTHNKDNFEKEEIFQNALMKGTTKENPYNTSNTLQECKNYANILSSNQNKETKGREITDSLYSYYYIYIHNNNINSIFIKEISGGKISDPVEVFYKSTYCNFVKEKNPYDSGIVIKYHFNSKKLFFPFNNIWRYVIYTNLLKVPFDDMVNAMEMSYHPLTDSKKSKIRIDLIYERTVKCNESFVVESVITNETNITEEIIIFLYDRRKERSRKCSSSRVRKDNWGDNGQRKDENSSVNAMFKTSWGESGSAKNSKKNQDFKYKTKQEYYNNKNVSSDNSSASSFLSSDDLEKLTDKDNYISDDTNEVYKKKTYIITGARVMKNILLPYQSIRLRWSFIVITCGFVTLPNVLIKRKTKIKNNVNVFSSPNIELFVI